jgi:transcriptional regulator with XRE-family HTH domain
MTFKQWEQEVLSRPGAKQRVETMTRNILLAQGLRAVRKRAGVSQKELARRLGVSQPRVAAIEKAEDVNVSTLARYAAALGGHARIEFVLGDQRCLVLDDEARAEPDSASNEAGGSDLSPTPRLVARAASARGKMAAVR